MIRRASWGRGVGALLLTAAPLTAQAASPPQGDNSIYGIGFRSFWLTDPVRDYKLDIDQARLSLKSRPLLLAHWYPAAPGGSGGKHADYLKNIEIEGELSQISALLAKRQSNIIREELGGDQEESIELKVRTYLARETGATIGVPPAPGRFPLVVYHPGNHGSIEENAVLFERLAQRGFAVVSSVFLDESGGSLNVDQGKGSFDDISFIRAWGSKQKGIDAERFALVGHSAGAHTILHYAAQNPEGVGAIVSLDTTQDYHSKFDIRWKTMSEALIENVDRYVAPSLIAANKEAPFLLFDAMKGSDRCYAATQDLKHSEFISLRYGDGDYREEAFRQYDELNRIIHGFLAARLRFEGNGPCANAPLSIDIGRKGVQAVRMPKGLDHPAHSHIADPHGLPSPRALFAAASADPAPLVETLLARVHERNPEHPIFRPSTAFALIWELAETDRLDKAAAFYAVYKSYGVDCLRLARWMARNWAKIGTAEEARRYAEFGLALEPDDPALAQALRDLKSPQKP